MSKKLFIVSIFLAVFCLSAAAEISEEFQEYDDEDEVQGFVVLENDYELEGANFSSEVEVMEEYSNLEIAMIEVEHGEFEQVVEEDFVEALEPNYRIEAMLSDSGVQIRADRAWDFNATGENVSVGVMDSGVAEHPNLEAEERIDYTGEGIGDDNGHGTHVAGIIGSNHQRYRGVAYESDIYDLKVLEESGRGRADRLLRAIDYSIRNDLDVAVLSLGSDVENCDGRDVMSRAVDTASNQGIIMVVAAGNIGPEQETITAPGCARNALTVGSVDKWDGIAPYSSRGLTSDERVKPDVVAPGTGIGSTSHTGGLVRKSGTSMAAPHVAGQASILISSNVSNDEVEERITSSVIDLGMEETVQGEGRIDVPESMDQEIERAELRVSRWQRLRNYLFNLLWL